MTNVSCQTCLRLTKWQSLVFPLAIVAAFFGIAGNYIGANHFAKKGVGFVKPLTIFVLAIFFLKLWYELFRNNKGSREGLSYFGGE